MRHGILASALLLTGCYDFEGDLGRIGFMSNLLVDGRSWEPGTAIADGTIARFGAMQRVGDEGEAAIEVQGTSDLEVVEQQGAELAITGEGTRGIVRFDGEERDQFRVRFAQASDLAFTHPAVRGPVTHIAEGAEVPLVASVRDRRGRALGYDPDSLTVEASGAASLWSDAGTFTLSADQGGSVSIDASLDGVWLPVDHMRVVAADQISKIRVRPFQIDLDFAAVCGAIAVGYTDAGDRVLGPDVTWEWVGGEVESDAPRDVLVWDCAGPPLDYGIL